MKLNVKEQNLYNTFVLGLRYVLLTYDRKFDYVSSKCINSGRLSMRHRKDRI